MRHATVAGLLCALVLHGGPAGAQQDNVDVDATGTAARPPTAPELLSLADHGGACTGVPDALPGVFDFTAACERHDTCYSLGVDRLACDRAFRADLLAACATQHPDALAVGRLLCAVFAELYYLGVTLFGGFAFAP